MQTMLICVLFWVLLLSLFSCKLVWAQGSFVVVLSDSSLPQHLRQNIVLPADLHSFIYENDTNTHNIQPYFPRKKSSKII